MTEPNDVPLPGRGRVAYDGRATKDENWFERTGLAGPAEPDSPRLVPTDDAPASHVRYLDVLALPQGAYPIWYEPPLPGESTELIATPVQLRRADS